MTYASESGLIYFLKWVALVLSVMCAVMHQTGLVVGSWFPNVAFLVIAATALLWWGTACGYWKARSGLPEGCCQKCGYNPTGNVSGACPECGTEIKYPCVKCGYDLRGNVSGVCPECGTGVKRP
jgi:hypothetical protein